MTRGQFLDWAQARDERYEFDGFQPVAMTGGTINHNVITLNIHRALHARLQGTGCRPFGPDVGVATIGDAVRYPHGVVTRTKVPGTDRRVPGVVAVFEVISPASGLIDRIDKVREYHAVPSIRRYVMLESTSIGLTVLARRGEGDQWTATTLIAGETLQMPELGIEIPVTELYQGTDLPAREDGSA
jgi:Uma2 family endonuclease